MDQVAIKYLSCLYEIGDNKMGIKKRLLSSMIKPLNAISNKFNYEVVLQQRYDEMIRTHSMGYDKVSNTLASSNDSFCFNKYLDYCRYRTFELVAEDIRRCVAENVGQYAVAEAGVFLGDFAWIINYYFNESELYLYDTFEGFAKDEVEKEIANGYTETKYMKEMDDYFSTAAISADEKMEIIKSKMRNAEKCVFRKGYFPESAKEETHKKWIFVSLDMDLYEPIKAGLLFFWPNMIKGGAIFIHDYNNVGFSGIKDAIEEVEDVLGPIPIVPLCDQGGTVVLRKI